MSNRLSLCTLQNQGCSAHVVTLQTIHKDILHGREMMIGQPLASITAGYIEEVFHIAKTAVLYENILHKTATVGIGLDKDATLAITSIIAVLYDDVSYSRRHFATDNHSMQALEMAVSDDDVL